MDFGTPKATICMTWYEWFSGRPSGACSDPPWGLTSALFTPADFFSRDDYFLSAVIWGRPENSTSTIVVKCTFFLLCHHPFSLRIYREFFHERGVQTGGVVFRKIKQTLHDHSFPVLRLFYIWGFRSYKLHSSGALLMNQIKLKINL